MRSSAAFEANGGKVIDEIPMGGPAAGAGLHAVLPARQGQEAGRVLRLRAGRRPCGRGGEDLRRARHAGGRHQADRPGRHHAGHQAAGDGRCRGRPDHHAPLQRRPRQSGEQALRRGLEEGIRRRTRRRTSWRSAATTAWRRSCTRSQATKGKIDADAALEALKGWKYDSPRGPITIDPETRDIVMNEYLSEVVKGTDGKLHQKVIGDDRQREGHVQGAARSVPAPPS